MLKDQEADLKLALLELVQVYTMGLFLPFPFLTTNHHIIVPINYCKYSEIARSGTATCAVTMAESGLMELIFNAISSSKDTTLIVLSFPIISNSYFFSLFPLLLCSPYSEFGYLHAVEYVQSDCDE